MYKRGETSINQLKGTFASLVEKLTSLRWLAMDGSRGLWVSFFNQLEMLENENQKHYVITFKSN